MFYCLRECDVDHKIETSIAGIPEGELEVGDRFRVIGHAIVVAFHEHGAEVTPLGGREQWVPAFREYHLKVTLAPIRQEET